MSRLRLLIEASASILIVVVVLAACRGSLVSLRTRAVSHDAAGVDLGSLAARRRARPPEPRHRHARHDARRSHRRLRRARTSRRPTFDRLADEGVLFEQAVSVGAADAAGALQHLHRQVSARARRPRQRRVLPRPGAAHARRAAQGARLPDRRLRRRLRARLASGASTRASTPTSTTSTSARSRAVSLGVDPAAGQRSRSTRRCRGSSRPAARRSSPGSISTIAHSPYRPPEPFASRYKGHPYNGEIAFADSQVGAARLARCSRTGSYDRTVVVVMGDHGESLGDHGESAHGFFVYNSVTHVPFVDPRAVQPDRRTAASPIRCDRSTSCRRCSTCSACRPRRASRARAWCR